MVKTVSKMLPLGVQAPDFTLPDTSSQQTLCCSQERVGHPLVIAFICNHCPFVVHIIEPLVTMLNTYQAKGVRSIAISSNDITTHPQDAPEFMMEFARAHQFQFPYCYDATQTVAQAYQAACTPDFYVFDSNGCLVYRGRFDASTPGNDVLVTGEDLQRALDAVLAGQPVSDQQHPSMGCNIKWKSE